MEAYCTGAMVKLCRKNVQFLIDLFLYTFLSEIFLFCLIPLLTWQLTNVLVVREALIAKPLKKTTKLCFPLIW